VKFSIPCSCGDRIGLDFFSIWDHLHLPAPAQKPQPTADGRHDYWRERDRRTKELARRDASLFGLSPSRVGHLLGVYGGRTTWERVIREEEGSHG
jgi:hypothetical protein